MGTDSKNTTLMKLIESFSRIKVGEITLLKIERLANKMGVDEKRIMNLYIKIKNAALKEKFSQTPFSERILLLPQCLRSRECPAERTEFGYVCRRCGRCEIKNIILMAETLGYMGSFILSGGSVVRRIIKKLKPRACIGVACLNELILGSMLTEKHGIAAQCVKLMRDGCVETCVNWGEVKRVLKLALKPL